MASKSERLAIIYNKIIEDLKTRDYSTYEIGKKYGIQGRDFGSVLVQLTFMAPIYDYKVKGKLYLGMIRS